MTAHGHTLPLFADSKMARFRAFHEANPVVWALFKRFAEEVYEAQRKRFENGIASGRLPAGATFDPSYSARVIFGRIRWHCDIETTGDAAFKLNDHHSPYYARLLADTDARFAGFFELRRLRA